VRALIWTHRNSAFKFLPVLGVYVVNCFENKAPDDVREKWRLRPGATGSETTVKVGDGSRGGPPLRRLRTEEQAKLLGASPVAAD
jgi:sarcosine oxidase/L-pipecolate oxidase